MAKKDAEDLYRAGEKKLGTDESAFLRVMALRHFYQLRATFEEYARVIITLQINISVVTMFKGLHSSEYGSFSTATSGHFKSFRFLCSLTFFLSSPSTALPLIHMTFGLICSRWLLELHD